MKILWVIAAVLTVAIALDGCKDRRQEPVPVPKSHAAAAGALPGAAAPNGSRAPGNDHRGPNGIAWFQGTIEEAFATSCPKRPAIFRVR